MGLVVFSGWNGIVGFWGLGGYFCGGREGGREVPLCD